MYRNSHKRAVPLKNMMRNDEFEKKLINRYRERNENIIVQVLQPKHKRPTQMQNTRKSSANRCCFVSPDRKDFGQMVTFGESLERQPCTKMKEEHSFNTDTTPLTSIRQYNSLIYYNDHKVDNSSQYVNPEDTGTSTCLETDESQWLNVDNTEQIDKYIKCEEVSAELPNTNKPSIEVYIEKTPRVKVIVEKFTKFKKDNIEVRRLEEKIVCIEYDVFEQIDSDAKEPIQRLRAFFSLKPTYGSDYDTGNADLLESLKGRFEIEDEDLKRLNTKEIEIIDAAIKINKSYLDDLNNILKRKTAINVKRKQSSLDVDYLYKMAQRDRAAVDDDFSDIPLSKYELDEVKNLILHKSNSSVYGFNRKVIDSKSPLEDKIKSDIAVISKCIINELVRQLERNEKGHF